jgi:hypothetical protein
MQTSKKSVLTANLRLTIVLIVLIVSGLFYWFYRSYYSNPSRVFYGMVANDLNTQSYVDISDQEELSGNLLTETLVNSGAKNVVISRETTKVANSNDVIQTLSIGTPSTDYSSYQKIEVGNTSSKYNKLLNVWGINSPSGISGQSGELYKSTVFTAFLFTSPSIRDTNQLLNFIIQNHVYSIKSSKVAKSGERQVINYEVGVNLKQYSRLLSLYAGLIGYKSHDETAIYSGNQIADLNISVDILSRRLIGLSYVGSDSLQVFQSYGIDSPIKLPTKTIALQDLKDQISLIK